MKICLICKVETNCGISLMGKPFICKTCFAHSLAKDYNAEKELKKAAKNLNKFAKKKEI